jgi:hypothetical protein
MIYTTLNKIRAHSPCESGWRKLLANLGKTSADDEPLALATILDSNGLDDTLWCLRSVPEHSATWRLYAVWCARQVQHLLTDAQSLAAIDIAEAHALGLATDEELSAARTDALAARDAAWAAASAAAWAARAASAAAWAAEAAMGAARGAWAAALDVARGAAMDAAKKAQEQHLRELLEAAA